jgi:hypothetical protein
MIHPSAADSSTHEEGPNALGSERAVRLRLLQCRLERRPSAVSRVTVEFSAPDNAPNIVCQREGTACPAGDLRLASLATLDAVSHATAGALQVELIGAKPIRAFDENLVVVAAVARYEGRATKIIGAAIVESDLLLATSRATLAAVNRLALPHLNGLLGAS